MILSEILRDSNYKITQFNLVEIQNIEKRIGKFAGISEAGSENGNWGRGRKGDRIHKT